jgi:hypothetical protein
MGELRLLDSERPMQLHGANEPPVMPERLIAIGRVGRVRKSTVIKECVLAALVSCRQYGLQRSHCDTHEMYLIHYPMCSVQSSDHCGACRSGLPDFSAINANAAREKTR